MIDPPNWSRDELENARIQSEREYRAKRNAESKEMYLGYFDGYRGLVEEVLDQTFDLTQLNTEASLLLAENRKQEVLRYLCGPPLSADDLKMLVEARTLDPNRLGQDSSAFGRLVEVVRSWHDRRRFPWVEEERKPTQEERHTAIVATTALLAMRRTEAQRRAGGAKDQELLVEAALIDAGFELVATRKVETLSQAPSAGQFCRETLLGSRKADFIIGLKDGRTMAVECKVSSSAVNSIKRLNNDAGSKAAAWVEEFGKKQVVPAVVLEGVFALTNLNQGQDQGLAIFWAHDLSRLTDWILSAKKQF